jgi:hypothetical protein
MIVPFALIHNIKRELRAGSETVSLKSYAYKVAITGGAGDLLLYVLCVNIHMCAHTKASLSLALLCVCVLNI